MMPRTPPHHARRQVLRLRSTLSLDGMARAGLRRDLLEMIDRDFNRPSIIIWSLYNGDCGLPNLWANPEKQA